MYRYLILERCDAVGIVRFNRPEQLNAMNRLFMDEIVAAFDELNHDESIHVVLVTGNGRAFMAGADIKEYAAQTDEEFYSFQKQGHTLYRLAEESAKPYIAVVNGFALGGGFEIACACDLIVASDDAVFGLPEVHLGLVPGGGGTQRLIQKIGINRVKELLYLGGRYTAGQLYDWGVVNRIAAPEKLEDAAMELAEKLSRRIPQAIAELKRLATLSTRPVELQERMDDEAATVFRLFHSEEAQKKIQDFAKK